MVAVPMPRGVPRNKSVPPVVEAPKVDAPEPVIEMGTVELVDEPKPARPKADHELSPEQRRIRDLEHQLALERGKKDPEPVDDPQAQPYLGEDGNIVIHVVEDGFTAFGKVWYRGQELEIRPGSTQWADTCDRFGQSWLERQDHRYFKRGPWPGKTYVDGAKVPWSGPGKAPDEETLAKVARTEAKRRRGVPSMPV